MKLISMTDFVLDKQRFKEDSDTAIFKATSYAIFLKQPLKLEMFVPCDDEGNALEEPKGTNLESSFFEMQIDYNLENKYQQAKEKVLFEEFQYCEKSNTVRNQVFIFSKQMIKEFTIEDLVKYDLTLTQSAIKKLGL
jgi:hypothetical protein